MDHIRTENIKSLVEHIVENFSDLFKGVEYVSTFKSIVLKHEQNLEMRGGGSADLGSTGGGNGLSLAAEQHRKKVVHTHTHAHPRTSSPHPLTRPFGRWHRRTRMRLTSARATTTRLGHSPHLVASCRTQTTQNHQEW